MSRVVIVGDCHWKRDPTSPYTRGLEKLFNYMMKEAYKDDNIIFTGDYFDETFTHSDTRYIAEAFLVEHGKQVAIVTGNHELSSSFGNALIPLKNLGIQVFSEPTNVIFGGYKVQFLPYLKKVSFMKEYGKITEECDFSVSHVSPPGMNWGNPDEISLNFKAKIGHFYGHIHEPHEFTNEAGTHVVIGVPQPTRQGEQYHQPRVIVIEDGKWRSEDLPVFFTIEEVKYGEQPKSKDNVINIVDAPSLEQVRETYKDFNVREEGVKVLRTIEKKDTKVTVDRMLKMDVPQKWIAWANENGISNEVRDITADYLNRSSIAS